MKGNFLHIIFTFVSFVAWNQKANVCLTVEPEEVGVNQNVSITIKSNVEGDIVENWPSNFLKGYGIQSLSRYVQDVNTGQMIQEHIVVFNGSFTKVGKYKIGPFYVKAGNKTYTSNSVKINVTSSPNQSGGGDVSNRQLREPAFGVVEVSSQKIYEGEPLVVSGRVYSKERTFGRPVLKRNFEFVGVNDEQALQQAESWEDVTLKNKQFVSFAFEKKVLFPVGSGTLTIQPFEIYLPFGSHGFNIISSTPVVEVVSLPPNPPTDFIGAVGEFDVVQNLQQKKIKQGDIIQVDVVVKGNGNLHAIEKPTLRVPKGMTTYGDPEIKENYLFTSLGAVGEVTYTFHIQVAKEGKQKIEPVQIAYFDPKQEQYIQVKAKNEIVIDVAGNPKFELANETDSLSSSTLANETNFKTKNQKGLFSKENEMVWIGAGGFVLLLSALFFLVFRKKKPKETIIEEKQEKQPAVQPILMHEVRDNFSKQGNIYRMSKKMGFIYQWRKR